MRNRRVCHQPLRLHDVLASWLRRQKPDAELRQYEIWTRWAELVGERLAARTQPHSLREGVLSVLVASSAWLNELSFMRGDLVRRINEVIGASTVTAIRLFSGPVRALPRFVKVEPVQPPPEVELPPEYIAEVEHEMASVEDPTLREAIRGARLAQLRRRLRHG
jgi:hypothetical protein